METHKKIREHISALADGELSDADLELALAALLAEDGQQAWALYHQIGDALRAAPWPDLPAGFAARLAARLDAEIAAGRRPHAAGAEVPAASAEATPPAPVSAP